MEIKTSLLAISDIHIGCPRLNPNELHDKFVKYLYPRITDKIGILFICGDFFDSRIDMSSYASFTSVEIMEELKSLCAKSGTDLRILRGTFTHDRTQPQHFLNRVEPGSTKVMMFDKLSIEYNEKTGLYIMYIPDNLSSQDIYADMRNLLDSKGIEKVDILVHHGYFKHMLPPNIQAPHGCLDADLIQKYVKGCVLNGHVHISSIYRNVISIGSFDRLVHGEEMPKGFYQIDIDTNNVYHFSFIENKEAQKFISIDLSAFIDMPVEAVNFFGKKWEKLKETFRPGETVRVRVISSDPAVIEGCSNLATSSWEKVIVDKATVRKREQILENVNMGLEELPVITPENIETLLLPIVQAKSPNVTEKDIHDVICDITNKKE